ncbi:CapA family protein [Haloarchaeobius amylolyticus]|uniref:CapA family protein n=1 Tax=Haloarchaeobius amylolyticus TaxID=1198296 RepID=UPI00226ED2BE
MSPAPGDDAESVTLAFAGDTMLGRLVDEHQRTRDATAVWGDLLPTIQTCDGVFLNLECCLSTGGDPWTETYHPFHFRADPEWAGPALRHAGVDWVSLANNHVLDFGVEGLYDTLDTLTSIGVACSGAGRTVAAARSPAVVSVGDCTVALVAFTDNTPEFAASQERPGTAYVEIDDSGSVPTETRDVVAESLAAATRADPDLLVVSLHWGPNMRTAPPQSFQSFAHWLVDQGVDLVFGHSAHVFHGVERYRDGLVLYDTGDLVDDYAVDSGLHNDRSFLFVVEVRAGSITGLRLVPTEIDEFAVNHAPDGVANWSRERMRTLSRRFGTEFRRDGEDLVLDLTVPPDTEKKAADD